MDVLDQRRRLETILRQSARRAALFELQSEGRNEVSDELLATYEAHHDQSHLLRYWPLPDSPEVEILDEQTLERLRQHGNQIVKYFGGNEGRESAMEITNIFRDSVNLSKKAPRIRDPPPVGLAIDATSTARGHADQSSRLANLEEKGLDLISKGRVATVVLAGGSGTRLGVSYPKGLLACADLAMASEFCQGEKKSLFELQCDRIRGMERRVHLERGQQVRLHVVFMTSPQTDDVTRKFFDSHNLFGLQREQVHFCTQSTMPCFSLDGKVLLCEPYKLAEAPGGNAGIYEAMVQDRVMDRIKADGADGEVLYQVVTVDNILAKLPDPTLVGVAVENGNDAPLDVVVKTTPKAHDHEAVGVFARRVYPSDALDAETWENKHKDRPISENPFLRWGVLEYTEIGSELASQRIDPSDPASQRVFNCANIAVHLFSETFIRRSSQQMRSSFTYYHVAHKPIVRSITVGDERAMSSSGDLWRLLSMGPEALGSEGTFSEQGIKLEAFIFDLFKFIENDRFGILSVSRDEEFSAIKNADDPSVSTTLRRGKDVENARKRDSPQTAVADFHRLHRKLLDDALAAEGTVEAEDVRKLLCAEAFGGVELHQTLCASASLVHRWLKTVTVDVIKNRLATFIATEQEKVGILVATKEGEVNIECP